MPFTPEMEFETLRPMSPQEIEDIAARAAGKAVSYALKEQKEPVVVPALIFFFLGAVFGTSCSILFLSRLLFG